MSIRTIGLVVTDQGFDAAALRAAAAMARREDAHLDVRGLAVSPVGFEADLAAGLPTGAGAIVEAGLLDAGPRADDLAAWARGALPEGVRASVEPLRAQLPGLSAAVARATRFCDLAVAARPFDLSWHPLGPVVLEALLFGTGAPVLVVPPGELGWTRPFGRVVLGWNGSDEALAAARGMIPLLAPGARVDVAIVGDEVRDNGEELAAWLARHGPEVEVSLLPQSLPRVADVLLSFARDRGAEALVMGGYGHSPFREAILGGPTRTLLREADLPLLLAHP